MFFVWPSRREQNILNQISKDNAKIYQKIYNDAWTYYTNLNEQEEIKMTREEARLKLDNAHVVGTDTILDALEILGLIKFEKKIDPIHSVIYNARVGTIGANDDQSQFLKRLDACGYKIVKAN